MELVDHSGGAVPPQTFGASLRAARLSRNISLDAIAAHTKINRAFLQDLERNDLSKWPSSQFYRESYVRAYAEAIGLDPREVVEGFRRDIAAAEATQAVPSSKPRRLTPVTIPIILAVTFVMAYALTRWVTPAREVQPAAADQIAEASAAGEGGNAVQGTPAAEPAPPQTNVVVPPEPAVEGELVITSTPSGANVIVNGIGRGTTPVRVQYLAPGPYTIRFVYPRHRSVTRRATISPSRLRVEVSATLEPSAPPQQKPAAEPAPAPEGEAAPATAPATTPEPVPTPEPAQEPASEPATAPQ